jgi:hypothetical protein
LGTNSAFALGPKKNTENLDRVEESFFGGVLYSLKHNKITVSQAVTG